MTRRFTLTGLLLFTTFAGLVLAFVVPRWRHLQRRRSHVDQIVSLLASADGSTFAALMGDRRLLVWDSAGNLRGQWTAPDSRHGKVALSFDGELVAFSTPRSSVDLYSVDTGTCRQTLPLWEIRFSPIQESFIGFGWAGVSAPHSLSGESPPAVLLPPPTHIPTWSADKFVAFSPDGKSFAMVSPHGVIELYDAATSRLIKKLTSPSAARESHEKIVWAPDGRSILTMSREGIRYGSQGTVTTSVIERWDVATGAVRRASLPVGRYLRETLFYLPGDSTRFVASPQSRLDVFDAETLKPLPMAIADYYADFAGGVRGETILAGNGHRVDLLDASTLELRRRLFKAASPPNAMPVFIGLFAWCIAFFVHRSRQNARLCQTCGRRFRVVGKKDVSVECLPCRQKEQTQLLPPALAEEDAMPPANT